ncbi:PTS sugar transporter subunit IIA [Tetragenococcus koreensis]|uniref:PTS sugar transporter subunit IIA n=1 Tax=Tetragenococcus koreensis TaxID=290335 RepID=UPI000F4F1A96|nr:PTS sugar transporter subunit IIA [Tetragenococcus koreensis]AYW44834.1 PTS mannose transporter subunit IIA [Tetragenococcus koreensis]MDN6492218.1 PTS sugar transporter subunit IIA [Leuconostoc sp.]GEN90405.1 PTS mannose transporter subunit IIA [Tetragenococcus koreensis]
MKKRYLVATHGELAKGFQSSLNILADKGNSIEIINAYVTDEDYTSQIVEFIQSVEQDEQAIIFTDLFGGSVNQRVLAEVLTQKKENIFIISNANLAILLTLIVGSEEEKLTDALISDAIEESQVRLVQTSMPTEDETFF